EKISWKDELREAIKYARDSSIDFDSFKKRLNDDYGNETKIRGKTLSFKHPERERFVRANKLGADYEKEGLENVIARQTEREQEHERVISRNEETQQNYGKLYQSSLERGNDERQHDTQSIKSDSRAIGQSHKQHEINQKNEETKQNYRNLYQSSLERGNDERQHDSQSIKSDSRAIGQSHEQHAINLEHARHNVARKRREFASDFDKWTRGNGKEQQQDGKSSSRDAKIERGGIESDKQRNKHEHDEHKEKFQRNSQKSRARDEGLSL